MKRTRRRRAGGSRLRGAPTRRPGARRGSAAGALGNLPAVLATDRPHAGATAVVIAAWLLQLLTKL